MTQTGIFMLTSQSRASNRMLDKTGEAAEMTPDLYPTIMNIPTDIFLSAAHFSSPFMLTSCIPNHDASVRQGLR